MVSPSASVGASRRLSHAHNLSLANDRPFVDIEVESANSWIERPIMLWSAELTSADLVSIGGCRLLSTDQDVD